MRPPDILTDLFSTELTEDGSIRSFFYIFQSLTEVDRKPITF